MMSRFGEQDIINNITQQIDTSSITNIGETSSPSPQAASPESVPTRAERKRNKEQGDSNREAFTLSPSSVTITEPPLPVYKDRTPHHTSTRDRSTFTFPPAVTIAIEEEKEEKEEAAVTESSNSSIKQKNKNKQTVETVSPTSKVTGLLSEEGEEDDVSEDISNNSPSAAASTTSSDNSDSKKKQKQKQNQQQQKQEEEQTTARTTSSPSSTALLNPTQFPTYLGTSYFPTYGWPTYAPSTFESMPSQKQHMITQREKKAAAKQLAADLAAGITSEPTASMIPTVKVVTEPPTRMRFYGSERDASFRTEAIDTPSPTVVTVTSKDEPSVDEGEGEVQGPSRYSYSRPGGDYHSSRYTDKPTKSKGVDNEALLRMENKTLEEIEGERFHSTPTNSPSAPTPPDGTTPSRWSGPSRGDDESSRDYSHGGYHRTSYPTITYPTDFPTTFEPTTRKPTNSPIGTPTYTPSVSPIAPKNMDLTIRNGQPPTPKLSDTGSKVNLSFNIQRPTQKPTSSKMNLQFFGGRGKPTVPPMTTAPPISSRWRQTMPPSQKPVSTEEPTYLIFPTYSPSSASTIPETAVTSSPPTIWPTYLPTASHTSQDKDEYANDREWTWKSTTTVSSEDEEEDDEMMAATSIYEKRTCPRYPFGVDPMSPKVEEQVFFTYGIQTATTAQEGFHSSSIEKQVEHIQLSLLNDVANHIVLCPNDETSVSMARSRFGDGSNILLDGGKFQQSTVRVYYIEDEAIATMSKFR